MLQRIRNLVAGFKPSNKSQDVSFCESCSEVCDADCRTTSLLYQAREKYSNYQTGSTGRY